MYEYLLSVAEKIIDASAPSAIALKYYDLKKHLVLKSSSSLAKQNFSQFRILQELPTKVNHFVTELNSKVNSTLNLHGLLSEKTQEKAHQIELPKPHFPMECENQREINCRNSDLSRPNKEIVEDNKWLIEQMEKIIRQNTILRKLCQKRA